MGAQIECEGTNSYAVFNNFRTQNTRDPFLGDNNDLTT